MDGDSGALGGEAREHLVDVHVRAGARPRLEHVDGELVAILAGEHLLAGRSDRVRTS
jgi:hypothetical protein